MVEGKDHQTKNKKFCPFGQILAKFSSLQLSMCKDHIYKKINLIMVPQSWQREKVNRSKIKIFLIGHIYEVKIIGIT